MEQPDRTDYQYKSLVSWYYIENSSNYPGPKGKVVPDAEGYDDPSKYEGTELYIPIDTKGYKEYAGSTPQFTDYEGNSVPFIKKYFKLNPNMTNPNMTNENLRMQFLSGVITEGEYKAIINKEIEDAEKASLNESMIGGIVGIGAINQIPPRAKADYETAFEHFLGGKYGLNEEMEVMVDSNMLKSYFNELISLADDMEYTPEMVDELKNLKNTLQGGKISVENALDLMQQTVDITKDGIDAVEALGQAVDYDEAIIDKAREIKGIDEVEEPTNY